MGVPISNVPRRVVYSASGTGPYAFTFEILANTDIAVYKDDTLLTLTTDYTVSIAGNGTGSITLTASPTGATQIAIVGNRTIKRTSDFVTGGDFFANTVNDELDQQTIFAQQNAEGLARALQAPQTDPTSINMTLPRKADRAGKYLAFDSNGNPIPGPTSTSVDVVAGITSDVTTVAGIASSVTTVAGNNTRVTTVANNISNVNTVGGISANVTTVAGIASNVTTVAGNSSNVTTVAGISSAVSGVAAISSAVSAVNSNSTNINSVASNATNINTAATNIAAIIDAPNQATSAAASAAAAAASAASGMYSAVQDKSANYSVVAADAGDLIRVNTSAGARTITLPTIGTTGITDGFKIAIVKWTGDGNAVTIARAGSDTINGATSYALGNQYSSVTLVADAETNQWFASASGLGTTNANVDVFSGNNSTTAFTLSGDPGAKNNTAVMIGGVYQAKSTYSVSGTTLTFSTAPPTGSSNIEVVWNSPLAIGTPSDDTVSTAKLQALAVTPAKLSADAQYMGFKNRIMNGAMMIDQRNAGASVSITTTNPYTLDRWKTEASQNSKFSVQQSSSAPAGFSNSLLVTSSSAYSITSTDGFIVEQRVEGYNTADLGWGTANAKAVTLSFWVQSSLTGTFGGCVGNAVFNRSYPFTYSIPVANTWTQISITIPGDTTGTWVGATNGLGLVVYFGIGVGSTYSGTAGSWSGTGYNSATGAVSVVGTNGATFYITGVQLEKGSTATAFDFRDYGRELAMCQRYYWRLMGSSGQQPAITTMALYTTTSAYGVVYFPVPMRANPTASYSLLSDFLVYSNGSSKTPTSILSGTAQGDTTVTCAEINTTFGTAFTAGNAGWMRCISTTTGYLEYSAEL